ncbi:DUF2218 domain-containing protein [Trujillonella endophytica]|uniref:DUF2218 domain-containing protein n=1 Tax=Trujillonella endophytica TaxID=673521 RepID=A0A1H8W6E5_9ACTN|nr:DUF2218 domain-containing protein [Trujillella endophytica]SEP23225.1 hypothetical protein SAMN05660991_04105 [Trujillella endophytica]
MTAPLTARADVATATPERYAMQLAAHLGRRSEVREEADGLRIVLAIGDCLLRPHEGSLELLATGADPEALERVESVVGSHLERFGRRTELRVVWQRG